MSKTMPTGAKKETSKRLTRKQKKFADYLLKNPKSTPKEAAVEAYNQTTDHTYEVIASENMSKPEILSYLNEHDLEAQNTVISVMMNARKKKKHPQFQKLALDSANTILDRVHGKATQRLEANSTVVNLNIEANEQLNQQFTEFLRQSTNQQ